MRLTIKVLVQVLFVLASWIYPILSRCAASSSLTFEEMQTSSYLSTISTTSSDADKEERPIGMKVMPIKMKVDITSPGVRIGLHAGSSCWVNLEYLGFLDFLEDD